MFDTSDEMHRNGIDASEYKSSDAHGACVEIGEKRSDSEKRGMI
jgi:hypothetical protein